MPKCQPQRAKVLRLARGFALVSLLATAMLVWFAIRYLQLAREADAYRRAPDCLAGAPRPAPDCRQHVPATILARRESGLFRTPARWVRVRTADGREQEIPLHDAFGPLVPGRQVQLVVWRQRVTALRTGAGETLTFENPPWQAEDERWSIALLAITCLLSAWITVSLYREASGSHAVWPGVPLT